MWRPLFLAIAIAGLAPAAEADNDVAAALQQIEDRWTAVRYEIKGDAEKLTAVHALERDSQALMQAHPSSMEAKVWYALSLLAEADIRHNASALSIVKDARRLLEEAEAQPNTMQVQILNALGDLYAQVPGWPIAFGNNKTAEEYLKRAIAADPGGLYNNYLYADFLEHHGRTREALAYFETALKAPPRPGHERLDTHRHKEVEDDLAALRRKLKI
jgi:tetratricopeptide (TPR) repeat protein